VSSVFGGQIWVFLRACPKHLSDYCSPVTHAISRKHLYALGALVLVTLVAWSALRKVSVSPRLAVGLVAVESEPGSHPQKLPMVLHGNTGLCAVFAVTNVAKDASIWFNTYALEVKVGAEWRRTVLPPYHTRVDDELRAWRKPWFLIDSEDIYDVCPPGRAWYYAVAWPPNVPTNGTWRLELRYGIAPSALTVKLNDAFDFTGTLGSVLFNKHRVQGTLLTPEVKQ
jgi:hypothetical protein